MMLRTSVDNATPSGYDSWITYLGSESWSAAITTSSGENSPSVVESDGPASDAVALEPTVLGRRRALQAALGGAAAGAAFVAPRIQGMSVVPDYAAAGTAACTTNSPKSVAVNSSRANRTCCSQALTQLGFAGTGASVNCNGLIPPDCGTPSINFGADTSGSLSILKNNAGPATNIDLNYNVGGGIKEFIASFHNTSKVGMAISGLSAGQSCTVNLNGSCVTGDFRISANNQTSNTDNSGSWGTLLNGYASGTINSDGTLMNRRKMDCNGYQTGGENNAAVVTTISMSCIC